MATSTHLTHDQREQEVLSDLEASFPNFAGKALAWTKLSDGQDPPDFISDKRVGLELVEWLSGAQMGSAKRRESRRDRIRALVGEDWETEYQPKKFRLACIVPKWSLRINDCDKKQFRHEFYACAAQIDRGWLVNPERIGSSYLHGDFSRWPTLDKYITAIRYIGGEPHGFCWIDVEEDGGAYDPHDAIRTLGQAIDNKLTAYASPEKQLHLQHHRLEELCLLVHGGFNAYRYNTPGRPLSLEDIARSAAEFYAAHPQRDIFHRVWFFDSLSTGGIADEVNRLLGFPPDAGRVRWLAQLWPRFAVDSRSVGDSR